VALRELRTGGIDSLERRSHLGDRERSVLQFPVARDDRFGKRDAVLLDLCRDELLLKTFPILLEVGEGLLSKGRGTEQGLALLLQLLQTLRVPA